MHEDSLSGPFLDDIRTSTQPKQDNKKKPDPRDRGRKKQRQERNQNIKSKGGVAVVDDNKQQQSRNTTNPRPGGLFRWLGQRGEKQSERKEDDGSSRINEKSSRQDSKEDKSSSSETSYANNNTSPNIGPDLAKLWWVNVWTQQLPDRPDQTLEKVAKKEGETQTKTADRKRDDSNKTKPKPKRSKEKTASKPANEPLMNTTALGLEAKAATGESAEEEEESPPSFVSSGVWAAVDGLTSLGLSRVHPAFRISRPLRPIRKSVAHITGLHGALSGKPKKAKPTTAPPEDEPLGEENLAMVRRRIAAIDKARENVERVAKEKGGKPKKGTRPGRDEAIEPDLPDATTVTATGMTILSTTRKSKEELKEEQRRKDRVKEIDKLMSEAQKRLQELACEKDVLQRRPNPLWNYTTENNRKKRGENETPTTRRFIFPAQDLVDEYLDFLFSSGRLVKLNHTDLWQSDGQEEDEDEMLGDDLGIFDDEDRQRKNGESKGGFWILRQSLGSGSTLGEKIGKLAEEAAYKAIAKAVMEVLAKSISAIHGINIMTHTDIRLSVEATPDLPPVLRQGIIPGGGKNYARQALQGAMKKRSRERRYPSGEAFVQHDAVVETLLSHCQISAPLLTLFPLAWQRAMISNIIFLVTAVVTDFCEGIQLEILGHRLSFSFTPITESDILNHIAMSGPNFRRQSWQTQQFEKAVEATAKDLSENLKFLDRWHERALGSGVLRSQIANLIARLVLTLVGDILGGAQLDLWAAHAGGPRIVAGLEFRTTPTYMEPQT